MKWDDSGLGRESSERETTPPSPPPTAWVQEEGDWYREETPQSPFTGTQLPAPVPEPGLFTTSPTCMEA